jgi:hypothetical protein
MQKGCSEDTTKLPLNKNAATTLQLQESRKALFTIRGAQARARGARQLPESVG